MRAKLPSLQAASRTLIRRDISTARCLQSHDNPLGLPKSGTPPQLPRAQRGLPQKRNIEGVRKIVAVSSAKGGVGKSTIATNLALAFSRQGHRTGILDADIFGPSIPTLLNLSGEPRLSDDGLLLPLTNYGVRAISMGFLTTTASSPIVWRGLMVQKAIQQLLHSVSWGGLDILILDLPPGTGDVQLTITQQLHLSGSLVISTPQDVALADARRGIEMFQKVGVEVLGLVQNMSVFVCPGCGEETHVFGRKGVDRLGEEYGVEVLADVPLDERICGDADAGRPTVVREPESKRAAVFGELARKVGAKIGL